MLKVREIATAAGTLACAVGIGFIMQNSDTAKERYGDTVPDKIEDTIPAAAFSSVVNTDGILEVEDITLTSAQTDSGVLAITSDTGVRLAAATDALEAPALSDAMPQPACAITASATPAANAMIDLVLSAPCLPNERVNVHHQGMIFSQSTSKSGGLDVSVPALARDAVVIFAFANGEGAVIEATIDDIDDFDRAALQWKGDAGFQIHAREFGANYGDVGHVWSGAPRGLGMLTQLGDSRVAQPFMAEVYSFPRTLEISPGLIDLSVEAEVTAFNCGLEIEAQSLEITADGIKTQDLTLAVPDCDTLGDFLVLNNLVQDLKVASN